MTLPNLSVREAAPPADRASAGDRASASSLLDGDPPIDAARLTPLENRRPAAEGLLATGWGLGLELGLALGLG